MHKIIGLTGFEGAGKSTAAQYLVERHGFTRVSFAAPLKKMLRTLDPYITSNNGYVTNRLSAVLQQCGGDETKVKESVYGKEYRRLLQVLGTDCIRAVDEDFWVKAAVAQMSDETARYVFDDVRFPNEAETILNFDNHYALWNIERAGYGPVNGHSSAAWAGNLGETVFLLNIDLESLHDQIDNAVEMAFGGVKA